MMRKAGARALTTRDHRCGRLCRRTRPASTRGNRTKRPRENVRAAVCPSCPLLYQGAPINASRLLVVVGCSTHYLLAFARTEGYTVAVPEFERAIVRLRHH